MMSRWVVVWVVLVGMGCQDQNEQADPSAPSCVAGQQVACACADGADSVQVCADDGSALGACDCAPGDGGASDTADDNPDVRGDAGPVGDCTSGVQETRDCGLEAAGTQSRRCVDEVWTEYSACVDPDETCDDGAIEQVPCGLNRRGRQSHTCEGARWSDFSACEDPDACIDGARRSERCGLNGRGDLDQSCVEGQWPDGLCNDPDDCVDGATGSDACGLNGQGRTPRTCTEGQWDPADCEDDDVCLNDSVEAEACGVEGNGRRERACADGQWAVFGPCDDPDRDCVDGSTESTLCGLNGRGRQTHTCDGGRFGPFEACADPDECIDATTQDRLCGVNDSGREGRTCIAGRFGQWSACDGADICENGLFETQGCGPNARGQRERACQDGQWAAWSGCEDSDVCRDGNEESRDCVGGAQTRRCAAGQWSVYGACVDVGCPGGDCPECIDALEPNNRPNQATELERSQPVTDLTLCGNSDPADHFRFASDAGPHVVRVSVDDVSDTGLLTLEGMDFTFPNGHGVSGSSLIDAPLEFSVQTPGDGQVQYEVVVHSTPIDVCGRVDSDNCVPCDDRFEPNPTSATANRLEFDTLYTDLGVCGGVFGDPEDTYRFEGRAGERYTLNFDRQGAGSSGPSAFGVVDGQGEIVPLQRPVDVDHIVSFEAAQDGPFYVVAQSQGGALAYWFIMQEGPPAECSDGLDNDDDGDIDFLDHGCTGPLDDEAGDQRTTCNDAIDNDDDGRADRFDAECVFAGQDAERVGLQVCDVPHALPLPRGVYVVDLDTRGLPDQRSGGCLAFAGDGADQPFVFTIDRPSRLVAETRGSGFDPVLYLTRGCDQPEEVACDDDGGPLDESRLVHILDPGRYTLYVDTFGFGAAGTTQLRTNLHDWPE